MSGGTSVKYPPEAEMSVLLKASLLDIGELSGCVGSFLNQETEGL